MWIYDHFHITEEETGTEKRRDLPKFAQPVSSRSRI